jgi:hypothetical protein
MQQLRQHPRPRTAEQVPNALALPTSDNHGAVVDLTGPEKEEPWAVRSSNFVPSQVASSPTSTASGSGLQSNHPVNTVNQYNDALMMLASGRNFLLHKLNESINGKAWITEKEDERLWLQPITQGVKSLTTVLHKRILKIKELQEKTGTKVDISKDESQLEACNDIIQSFQKVMLATSAIYFCRQNVAQAAQAWADDAGCPEKEIRLEMESKQLTFTETELTEESWFLALAPSCQSSLEIDFCVS